jgi:serine/threonine protein kinase/tetratricopeptide (TPR) repeat protein
MALSPGTRLGPYEIVSPLGAGGMGEVYRASDPRLGREVAVKVLADHLTRDADLLRRFETETRAVAALSHPNILTIHDVGRDGEVSYAVTELLEGETLRVRLAPGPLPWIKAVEVAIAVADGLAAAHGRGIIHRDLKPENVFSTSDGRVKILDFGLARRKSPLPKEDVTSAPTAAGATEPGVVLGTAGYMSPEQVRGEAADAPSDIFSLGCVLHEMLSGRRPFGGATTAETLVAILRDEPPDLLQAGVTMPWELSRVLARCLQKGPTDRYASARDLAFELRAVLSAASGLKISLSAHRRPIASLAVLPLVNAGGDPETEYLSDGITESVISSLSRLPGLRVMARSTVFRYKGKDLDPLAVGRELKVQAVVSGRLLHRGDRLVLRAELVDVSDGSQLWGEQYSRDLSDIFAVEEEMARQISENLRLKISGEDEKRLARRATESAEAYRLYLKGRFYWNKRTADGLRRGIEFFQHAIETDPEYALAYVGLADCHGVLAFYAAVAPRDGFPKAKAAATRALELDPTLAEAHTSLAYARHYFDWDWKGAEEEYRRALAVNAGYSTAHLFYLNLLTTLGRFDEALAEVRAGLEIDPLSLILSSSAGFIRLFARRYDEALPHFLRTLEMDGSFVPAHFYLGSTYEQMGRLDDAARELGDAVRYSGGGLLYVAALARVEAAAGRRGEAERSLAALDSNPDGRYVPSFWVATVHAALGDRDTAFHWLEKAFEERSHGLTFLRVDPALDSLRGDPRFDELVRRLHFPGGD